MGETREVIRLHFEPNRAIKVSALADTGSTLTVITEDDARELGVTPYRYEVATLADGREVKIGIAQVTTEFRGVRSVTDVCISPGKERLLGLIDLERFGYAVNPVQRRLDKVGIKLLAFRSI